MYKRLKKGKTVYSEKAAKISCCAKGMLYDSVKNQLIETMKLPAEYNEISSEINTMGYFILRTGHNFNGYYEAVSGKAVFNNKRVEICKVLSDICKSAEPYIAKRGLVLINRIPNENIFVNIDYERFCYAVSDILMNAAENTPEGGKIRISLSKTKKFVKIMISDNGIGMDEESAAHCVEPFFKKGRAGDKNKMGLGLTLAHYFICESGGRLNINSKSGSGTAVNMILPLMKDDGTNLSVETVVPDIIGEKLSPVHIVLSTLGE